MNVGMLRSNWDIERESDQKKGLAQPDMQKAAAEDAVTMDLDPLAWKKFRGTDLTDAIIRRRSERRYSPAPISLDELSWLLYAIQGLQEELPRASKRTAASAGARHPFETYIAALGVTGLEPGMYRYLPYGHRLVLEQKAESPEQLRQQTETALNGQGWGAPLVFLWSAIPYRTEWRYPGRSEKLVSLDAGHLCQNLYLACAAIGAGTCAIGAYDQKLSDQLLGLDGENELVVYAAPVGKLEA